MSKYLELVEISDGVIVLRRSDSKESPLVKIEFSKEVKNLLNGMEFDVAKEMIKSGIETLNTDIDIESFDDELTEHLLDRETPIEWYTNLDFPLRYQLLFLRLLDPLIRR